MGIDTEINREQIFDAFPDLRHDPNFKLLSPCTYEYNCIAWAMGLDNVWVDPFPDAGHWWPDGVERGLSPEHLIAAFKAVGFEISSDAEPEAGFDKVALYKNGDEWSHATRIVERGIESSKFGSAWDGQHSHNLCHDETDGKVSNPYGNIFAYMKRRKKTITIPPTGRIAVNEDLLNQLKKRLGK
jgi:hypothetical protein